MIDDITGRLERLLTTTRHARRAEQELIAAAPGVIHALTSLIAEHPTVLEHDSAPLYHVKACWWRLPDAAGSTDFYGFPPRRGTPGLTVADAVCRDNHVLTTPHPSLELVEIHFTYAATPDEAAPRAMATPPNDFAYAAGDGVWRRVAIELDLLVRSLEAQVDSRLTTAVTGLEQLTP